jgi:hypothetical protein
MSKIAISSHYAVSKSTMLGLIKHFYEYGKHTSTTAKFDEIESKFSFVALFIVDCMFSQRSI